ncbi:hypothetical protein AwDysgo_01660 [Bacteroidales bacterium]|nr:hypothetical protein AwDysgo_01660 [Bacteroidales bacterium]
MNKKIYLSLLVMATVFGLASCSSKLKPLASNYIKAEPQPLEVVGGKVPVTINATFPEKWFNKNATVIVKPVLRYEGGEAWGTSYTFQGEKVAGNGQTIPQKAGANVTMTSSFDYVPDMIKSELFLTFDAKIGNKTIQLPEIKIADGVLATAAFANALNEAAAIAPDKFQRIIKEAYDANIMFLIQQAELRSGELRKTELGDWKNTVKNANEAPNQKVDIEISAYASPDGGLELNEKLAVQREKNTSKYLTAEMKKAKVDAPINAKYTAQDWEGFKELVEKSKIQDKDLVLRTLSMYTDPEQREQEIKNISSVFSALADEILPQLRRSRLTANVEIIGKSDEEISSLAVSNPKGLNIEEILYAATLVKTNAEKEKIYTKTTELYSKDARAFNNLGVIEFAKGNVAAADKFFSQASQVSGGKSAEANCNLAFIALANNDKAKASQLLGNASGVAELNNALGLIALMNGEYSKAASSFGSTKSNNAALAQILSKDYNKASTTLNAVGAPNATTAYLKAVVAARTNNLKDVVSNLKEVGSKDKKMLAKAASDVEFAKFASNAEFINAIK